MIAVLFLFFAFLGTIATVQTRKLETIGKDSNDFLLNFDKQKMVLLVKNMGNHLEMENIDPEARETQPASENDNVTLKFQNNCRVGKSKMIKDINEFIENEVGVSNEDCKCVNVEPGLPVKKYHRWYIRQPTFNLPIFVVELQGPKSHIVKANIAENQMTLKKKKYFIVKSTCDICYNGTEDGMQMILLHCNELHMFCSVCIPKFPQHNCPLCKAPITIDAQLRKKIFATIFLPFCLFGDYVQSWFTISFLSAARFKNFQDADRKKIVKTYVRFVSPYALVIAIQFLTGNSVFISSPTPSIRTRIPYDIICKLTRNGEHMLVSKIFDAEHYWTDVSWDIVNPEYGYSMAGAFFDAKKIVGMLINLRWVLFCFFAFNINRFVKHITNNKIGVNFVFFGPTMFVLGFPFIGVGCQELIIHLAHATFVTSLLQSSKNYNVKLLLIFSTLSILIWTCGFHIWGINLFLCGYPPQLGYKMDTNAQDVLGERWVSNNDVWYVFIRYFFNKPCWECLGEILTLSTFLGHILFIHVEMGDNPEKVEKVKKVLTSYVQYVKNKLESLIIPNFDFII